MKSMLFEIFKFELKYRFRRPATYLYFGLMFLLCFLAVTTDVVRIGDTTGLVKENSPIVITRMMLIVSAFFSMIISAIMGVGVLRDFEHQTESLMFVNPIKKADYLLGRFLGSFVILIFVYSGMLLGFMIGDFMPWREKENLLPFSLITFLHPFIFYIIPNLFFVGALFFASGTLSRRMMVVYTQGMLVFAVYLIALSFSRDLENKYIGAIFDPYAIRTVSFVTEYWSAAQQNTMLVPLEGIALWNRILWIGLGILICIFTYIRFNFNVVQGSLFKKKATKEEKEKTPIIPVPLVRQTLNMFTYLKQVMMMTTFYFRMVLKEVAFRAIVFAGIVLLLSNARAMGNFYGTTLLPTTYSILELIQGFNLFFFIIIVFYTAELVWKERLVRINLIYDALPMPDAIPLISKFLGMVLVLIFLLLMLILCGIGIQTFKGYFNYELHLYFSTLFTETLLTMVLSLLLGFFVQVMVNDKFVGVAVMIVFFVATSAMNFWGWEHDLIQFASAALGTYSDMNKYGHYTTPFSWFEVYWLGFTFVLFALAVMFSVRGSEAIIKTRAKIGKLRLTKPLLSFAIISFVTFTLSGCYIYYNTNILNTYANSKDREKLQAEFEKTLKKYENTPQPRIIASNLKVDLFPKERDFVAEGYYILKNKTSQPITDIHIQKFYDGACTTEISFEGGASIKEEYEKFDYTVYTLSSPLDSGKTVKMNFKVKYDTKGFVESGSNTSVIYNGTFFNNTYFPSFGYNEGFELSDKDTRKENGLEPKNDRLMEQTDERGLSQNLFGDDADHIDFEIVVSTDEDQIALAPGYLQKEWTENGRKYFHYKMDVPMCNFYSIVSARYEVMKDTWTRPDGEKVSLEIYYHPEHQYNLKRMMDGMKHSLEYYGQKFSSYQYRQMRIMEFPRYATFAQSFANTVPFSEGIGFILNIKEGEDVDIPYYVTCHEMGHQWWGHQVMEANVKGSAMLSETLSQYSALMVMKHHYPAEQMKKFLEHELDRYLTGRAREEKKENPLALVESQDYIHYRKGSLIMYAFQDYVGEDSVNAALKRYLEKWKYSEMRYPTTQDLLQEFRKVTPDSLQYLITDMFETITFYENKSEKAEFEDIGNGKFKVTLETSTQKFRADSIGNETPIEFKDWIDIGVFAKDDKGKDKLLYLQKHKIMQKDNKFEITVEGKPEKVGIDPIHKLIDRHPKDNLKSVIEKKKS
jgi:hypothetical protein